MRRYFDVIDQTFYFPTPEFNINGEGELNFHNIPLMDIIREYGTPLKLSYLPKITSNIQQANQWFNEAIARVNYRGNYRYCYCTKASHFQFVMERALQENVHLETSSAYDMMILRKLHQEGLISKNTYIICNGYKRELYLQYITEFLNEGFVNCIPVVDNLDELNYYENHVNQSYPFGIRMAANEEPRFELYTSRLGIRYEDVLNFYRYRVKGKTKARLKMLHFFINSGIRDTSYYWNELSKFVYKYTELKKLAPELDTMDIGGGFPVKDSLHHTYDYQYMANTIVESILEICRENDVHEPDIITEFGIYTVGESGATIYSVLGQKKQNDVELWYMIDGSFITQLPDVWATKEKYIMLAINNWYNRYRRVNLGGLTCDSMDYYNSDTRSFEVFMPELPPDQQQYIGFFHTGAYQESLGGYGGIQHCLIPAPKHVLIDRDPDGNIRTELFAPEQSSEQMLNILGY